MKNIFASFTLATLLAIPSFASAQLDGSWKGELDLGSMKLPLEFQFSDTGTDHPGCIILSPQQTKEEIPASVDFCKNDSVAVSVALLGMKYSGKTEGDSIRGTFIQGNLTLPLNLQRGKAPEVKRPQLPKEPYPYATRPFKVVNPEDGVCLGGTLTLPVGYSEGDEVPVVVMVTGSGQQDRDETIFMHKPFLVIADYLAKNGIASFRYDDRGIGSSDGDIEKVTLYSNAADATSALKAMRDLKKFSSVGLFGHSEGGLIAFMIGSQPGVADFIISMAGPSVPGEQVLKQQLLDICHASEMSEEEIAAAVAQQENAIENPNGPWLKSFLEYNPATAIRKICVPTFAFYGGKDLQVNAQQNMETLESLFPGDGEMLTVKTYEGLNHLMQPAVKGLMEEYGAIELTISPRVLNDMVSFIKSLKDDEQQ